MEIASHRAAVAEALLSLESALERLVDALSHRPVVATVAGETTELGAIRLACEAYSAINYEMEDQVGDSVVCLGLLGVTSEVLKRAEAVNAAKLALKTLFAPLQRVRIRVPIKGASGTKAIPALRVILRNIQRSDLNINAAYRKIPILGAPPAAVSYTRANTRSVYRKSIGEIFDMLSNVDSPVAAADRERLSALNRRQTHLALARFRYENIRANVLYTRLDSRGRGRIQISAELPLIYASGRSPIIPQVQFPAERQSRPSRKGRTALLEPEPFLHSIPVYRYL